MSSTGQTSIKSPPLLIYHIQPGLIWDGKTLICDSATHSHGCKTTQTVHIELMFVMIYLRNILVINLKHHWPLMPSDLSFCICFKGGLPGQQHVPKIVLFCCFLLPLLFYFDTHHRWLQVGAGKGHLFISGEWSWWRAMAFTFGQDKGMEVRPILEHQNPHPFIIQCFKVSSGSYCMEAQWHQKKNNSVRHDLLS